MLIIDNTSVLTNLNSVVTIGKFDGLHKGHIKILKKVCEEARSNGLKKLAASFVNHPGSLNNPNFKGVLMAESAKTSKLSGFDFDFYCELRFSEELKNTSAVDFFNEFILEKWKTKILVVGDDFHFGKDRIGNIELLKELCSKHYIKLIVVEREEYEGEPISSSRIREALELGNVDKANAMLGYNYTVKGMVDEGRKLGRTIDFPTINIHPSRLKYVPKFGVYGSYIYIDGVKYNAITNVGIKPSFENEGLSVESHIIGFRGDLYDTYQIIELIEYMRPEKKFESLDELKKQLEYDKKVWTNK